MSEIALQWSLDQSSTDVLRVSRGILAAATSDNIQVIALLACERFGTTLAMSTPVTAKVHDLCAHGRTSHVFNYIKATIGYRSGDSAWQLAQSDGGLRFLGLAACLLTMNYWEAAEALKLMIIATAQDKCLVPTKNQLKALLRALDCRLAKAGFANDVIGYQLLLSGTRRSKDDPRPQQPTTQVLLQLVQAMSDIGRIGPMGKSLHVYLRLEGAPWIIAFAKWTLGEMPTVRMGDGRTVGASKTFTVILHDELDRNDVEIDVVSEVGDICELIRESRSSEKAIKGMISIQAYGQAMLNRLSSWGCHDHGNCKRAIIDACRRFIQWLKARNPAERLGGAGITLQPMLLEPTMHPGSIFDEERVKAVACSLFGDDVPAIWDLDLQDERPWFFEKLNPEGLARVAEFVTDILVLSLFEARDPAGLLLRYHKLPITSDLTSLGRQVKKLLSQESMAEAPRWEVHDVVEHCLRSFGHKAPRRGLGHWIMTSGHGQCFYPEMLERRELSRHGVLNMVCVPGELQMDGEVYQGIEGTDIVRTLPGRSDGHAWIQSYMPSRDEHGSTRARGVGPSDIRDEWHVTARDKILRLSVVLYNKTSQYISMDPINAVYYGISAVYVNCAHDPSLPPTTPVSPPGCSVEKYLYTPDVIDTHGDLQARFFAMALGEAFVIREKACLECCIKACQVLDFALIMI